MFRILTGVSHVLVCFLHVPTFRVFDGSLLGSRDKDGMLEGIDVGIIEGYYEL
jgi:hypothetical protein